jgi:hypothetical protein
MKKNKIMPTDHTDPAHLRDETCTPKCFGPEDKILKCRYCGWKGRRQDAEHHQLYGLQCPRCETASLEDLKVPD